MRGRRRAGIVTAVGLLLAATGCASTVATGAGASDRATTVALSEQLDHVHALLVVDGGTALLAGTHTGVMRVTADGGVSRVGAAQDDFMGLSSDGTDLLSSGHPGAGSTEPNPLGLRRSTDGALTWRTVSASGQADFHSIAAAGRRVAAASGGALGMSGDGGATWTDGGLARVRSVAWLGGSLLAITDQGLQMSKGGTAAFQPVLDAPPLAQLTADSSGAAAWGIDGSGTAWRTSDGTAWSVVGTLGQVEAIAGTTTQIWGVGPAGLTTITAP